MLTTPTRSEEERRAVGYGAKSAPMCAMTLATLALITILAPGGSAAAAEDLTLIRCVDYRAPLPDTSSEPIQFYRLNEPFDVTLNLERKVGRFRSTFGAVSRERPASLTVAADSYTLEAQGSIGGRHMSEWVTLDRLDGTVAHYVQFRGGPEMRMKAQGSCRRMEQRF